MTLLYIIGIACAVVAVAIFLIRRARIRKPSFTIPEIFEYRYTTQNGVKILSVVPVPDFVQMLIENGIGTQIWKSHQAYPKWALVPLTARTAIQPGYLTSLSMQLEMLSSPRKQRKKLQNAQDSPAITPFPELQTFSNSGILASANIATLLKRCN